MPATTEHTDKECVDMSIEGEDVECEEFDHETTESPNEAKAPVTLIGLIVTVVGFSLLGMD